MDKKHTSPRTSGQSLVEFAIILTVVLLLILGSIDLGRGIYAFSVIQNAAREGARYGSLHPADAGGILAAARHLAHGLDVGSMSVTHGFPNTETVRVTVTYTFNPITPMLARLISGGSGITLTSRAQMVLE